MKTGIRNYYLDKYGLTEGAKIMAAHGYDAIDYNFQDTSTVYYTAREEDFLANMMTIKKALLKEGIKVNQIHGPWRVPQDSTEDERADWFGKMAKALVMAKHLGAKYMAVHPLMPYGASSPKNPEEVYAINKKYYEALAKVGAGLGVTVCLENMPFRDFPLSSTESILGLVKDIDHPNLKVCFDTGHANITGIAPGEFARTLGSRLKVLHIHDNLGLNPHCEGWSDMHTAPYQGNIDWADFSCALREIGYDGTLSFETDTFLARQTKESFPVALRYLRELIETIEKL